MKLKQEYKQCGTQMEKQIHNTLLATMDLAVFRVDCILDNLDDVLRHVPADKLDELDKKWLDKHVENVEHFSRQLVKQIAEEVTHKFYEPGNDDRERR